MSTPDLPVSSQAETRKGLTIVVGAWIGTRTITVVGGVPAGMLKERINQ